MKNYRKYIFYFIIGSVFLLGLLFRLKIYLFNRPLWMDECFIFNNLYGKKFMEMFGLLISKQSAPPLFLWIEKAFYLCFGIKEQVLRFFPFICSIFSIPIFYFFSKIFLKKDISLIFASILFAVNIQHIYYSQEVKQYSSDVLLFMILFIFLNKLSIKNFNIKDIIYYSIITSVFPLLSIPSYFLIGAWVLKELIIYKTEHIKKLIVVQIPIFIMSIFYCITTIIPQHKVFIDSYTQIWQPGFLTLNITEDIKVIFHNLYYFFAPNNLIILISGLICIGIILFIKEYKQKEVILLLLSVFFILLFSFMRVYPIYERVCLYVLPILIIFAVKILDLLSINKKILSCIIIIAFIFSFGKYNYSYLKDCYSANIWNTKQIRHFSKQFLGSYPNPRELMQILINNYHNETVIINIPSKYQYEYYKKYYEFQPKKEIYPSNKIKNNPIAFKKELDNITNPQEKYVFYISDDWNKDAYELNIIKKWKDKHEVLFEKDLNGSYILYLRTK